MSALLIAKATLVLCLAITAAAIARDFSAARRHLIWLIALSSCVWLVASSPVMPRIVIHTTAAAPTVSSRSVTIADQPPIASMVHRPSARSIPLPAHPLIALWIIGCVALLARYAAGFIGTSRLARRASATELAGAIGIRRPVRVGYSEDARSPITFGILKPVVLLPREAAFWPLERRRAVFLHEAAHIARGDWFAQVIGQVACALLWFHPLVWFAFARLRDEAERAADDAVLRSGMPASEYATHLLDLARRAGNVPLNLAAVGIVSTDRLERRFLAMFDARRSRASVKLRARALVTGGALAIVCPLSALRVAPRAPHMQAPLTRISVPRAALPPAPMQQTHLPVVRDSAREIPDTPAVSRPPIAAPNDPAPPRIGNPDFSGKWTQDSAASHAGVFVSDSVIITQYGNTISFESHGHAAGVPTYGNLHEIWFDGGQSHGMTITGESLSSVTASAIWLGDTLVLTTHLEKTGHSMHTIERMSLSPDGQTLTNSNVTLVDGKPQWAQPLTFVLRRMHP
jgi:beta-lactamase regulating signal transducer with metallopeptidase domain